MRRPSIGLFSFLVLAMMLGSLRPTPTAKASAVDLFGYGSRGIAMAGTAVSSATGHDAVYYNPAGLAFAKRPSFAIGYQQGFFELEILGEDTHTQTSPALQLGLGIPLPLKGWMANRLALGLGLVIPQTSILIADIPRPGTPHFVLLDNRAQVVSIQGGIAFRPLDFLSVGVGFIALATLEGRVAVAPDETGAFASEVSDKLFARFAPVAGIRAQPLEWLNLGLSYHGESKADFDFPIEAELGDVAAQIGLGGLGIEVLPLPELTVAGVAQFDPEQVSIEASFLPLHWLLLAAGTTWKRWSRFGNPIEYTAVPEGYPAQPAPNFHDTWTFRIGGELELCAGPVHFEPRFGLSWEPTPTGEQRDFHNYLDNDRLTTAMGLGVEWESIHLGIALQWQHLLDREHDKTGYADWQDMPGHSRLTHGGDILFWAIELGAEL